MKCTAVNPATRFTADVSMPFSRQAFSRKSPKWSSADRVIYPQEIPSLDAMCRTLLVSPA